MIHFDLYKKNVKMIIPSFNAIKTIYCFPSKTCCFFRGIPWCFQVGGFYSNQAQTP